MSLHMQQSADAMADEALARFETTGRGGVGREMVLRRARAFRHNLQYYATLGLAAV
jgi:hypothetical protein